MDSLELERRISLLVKSAGFRLIKAHWRLARRKPLLSVVADAEDHNISVSECADLSRMISDLLDSYPHEFPDYRLEVSSPGLNHPLEPWQLQKNVGRTVKVQYSDQNALKIHTGILVSVDVNRISVQDLKTAATWDFTLEDVRGIFVIPKLC
ncbi:MAG: hypothetical protein ABH878_00375 [bacterium]